MTITVVTKSMGRRAYDGVTLVTHANTHVEFKYFTTFTYHETVRIPIEDVVEFRVGNRLIEFSSLKSTEITD